MRYPGHFTIVRALFELGCFEEHVRTPDGTVLEPKALLRRLLEQRLAFPDVRDLVVLRCIVTGRHQGRPCTRTYDVLERYDEHTGFTAMERATALSGLQLVAYLQARQMVKPGAPAARGRHSRCSDTSTSCRSNGIHVRASA